MVLMNERTFRGRRRSEGTPIVLMNEFYLNVVGLKGPMVLMDELFLDVTDLKGPMVLMNELFLDVTGLKGPMVLMNERTFFCTWV